jgi:hypothetical protein
MMRVIAVTHLPFAGFFFAASTARAVLLSILPLKALSLLGSAQHVSVLFFVVSVCGIGASLGIYSILRHISLRTGFLISSLAMVISIALLWTQDLWTFSLGMMFHVFGITSMEVILSLYVMQKIPRSQLSEFEPLRMVSTVMALSIGPWLGVYLQSRYADWLPFMVAAAGVLTTLIYFRWLGLHHVVMKRSSFGTVNPVRHVRRFFRQPRLRLAWILTLARSSWWVLFIIYTPIYAVHSGLGELMGSAIVSIGSAWTLTVPYWGWIARRYSLRLLMRMGFIVTSLMTLAIFVFAGIPSVAVVLLVFAALGATMLDGSGHVLFLRAVRSRERAEMTGVFQTYRDVANLAVPGIFAILLKVFALPIVYAGGAGWTIAAAITSRHIPKKM